MKSGSHTRQHFISQKLKMQWVLTYIGLLKKKSHFENLVLGFCMQIVLKLKIIVVRIQCFLSIYHLYHNCCISFWIFKFILNRYSLFSSGCILESSSDFNNTHCHKRNAFFTYAILCQRDQIINMNILKVQINIRCVLMN